MARLSKGLFQGGRRFQAALELLAISGDQEQAIVGRRAEKDHDDENLRRLEDLKIELRPA